MLPEMAASYAVGMIPSASLTGLHLFLQKRKLETTAMRRLQANLEKIGHYWSDTDSSVLPRSSESLSQDFEKYRRSLFVFGGICLFLSWLGFFAQLMVMVSIRYLARSRLEQRLFASDLVEENLPADHVKARVDEILALG